MSTPARALVLALAFPQLALAAPTGGLRARVQDETGAPLPGVQVTVRASDASTERQGNTSGSGVFEAPALPLGPHEMTFHLAGFAPASREVVLAEGAVAEIDVTLRLALDAEVLVTGRPALRDLAGLDEPVNGLVGLASAASEGIVSGARLEERPISRPADVFEAVPGVVVSQHSGEGKASQYYVRGFNIDHGTDLATFVAGTPVNLPSHAHGQGYSDNNFVVSELVSGVHFQKGAYDAEQGDFSAAGAIDVNYRSTLERPIIKLEGGEGGFGRVLVAASTRIGAGHLLYAAELGQSDGPWLRPDAHRKWNGVLRLSQGDVRNGWSLTGMAYAARWNATHQIPARAVSSGRLDRFGAVDTSDGGRTHRYTLAGEWRRRTAAGLTTVKAYAIDYGLDLFSNFTYFLDDPVNGDQFEQRDVRRVFGASVSRRFLSHWFGRDVESVAGAAGRLDDIPLVGLFHTRQRQRLSTIRQDDVRQASGSAFFQTSVQWAPWARTVAGLRGDLYGFEVRGDVPARSGARAAALGSPKLSLVLGPWRNTELYANWGRGFHSNDARGVVQGKAPARPLVRTQGAELGLRTFARGGLQSTLTFWKLDLDSELVFVGDAGTTEASRASRRLGVEWSNAWTPTPWLTLDADLAWSRARFRDADPAGTRIPGAVEGVASAGITLSDRGPLSGSLRLRYFGPRPLIEDDSVRSKSATTLNARLTYPLGSRYALSLEIFNATDAKVSDVDYFYRSRLPGEAEAGIEDVHTHPLAPRTVRAGITASF